MHRVGLLAAAMLALGCSGNNYGEADVEGAVGDFGFGQEITAYHGTRHIVIVDRHIDCIDMAWVTRNYFGAEGATSPVEFGAIQFTFDSDTPEAGQFSLEPGGAVAGWRLINADVPSGGEGTIDAETSREGILTVDTAGEDEVSGSFDVLYEDSNAAGTFTSVHCRNVR